MAEAMRWALLVAGATCALTALACHADSGTPGPAPVDAGVDAPPPDASGGGHDAGVDAGGDGGSPLQPPEEGWVAVSGFYEACQGQALGELAKWPARSWVSCGPGCTASSASTLTGGITERLVSGATGLGEHIYYRSNTRLGDWTYDELRQLPGDEVVAVVRYKNKCLASAIKDDAALIFGAMDGDADWVGVFDPASMKMTMSATPYLLDTEVRRKWWQFDGGWGVLANEQIRLALTPGDATLTVVEPTSSYKSDGRARGGRVCWVDWGTTPSTLRAWTSALGTHTLLDPPANVAGLALGDQLAVWVSATGTNSVIGAFDSARLAWMPVDASPGSAAAVLGPDVTGQIGGGVISATQGMRMAMTANPSSGNKANGTLIFDAASSKQWFVPSPRGTGSEVLAMSASEVLIGEVDLVTLGEYVRYLRLDLSKLDELRIE
ncbi:MAG: hypothetical protein WKG00_11040 [Polyangiaceae bacterium]